MPFLPTVRRAAVAVFTLVALAAPLRAEVTRIEVTERGLLADGKAFGNVGAYERLRGRLYFSVDPSAAENRTIVDVDLAPRDAAGRVNFSADFVLLKPLDPARGNNRLLYEVNNRGNLALLSQFNDAQSSNWPTTEAQAGSGFLMEQGYSLLWTGWTWDITPGNDRLVAQLPVALENGKPITGLVNGEITVNAATDSAKHTGMISIGYEPVNIDDPAATLTVRDSGLGARTAIPRAQWRFGRVVDGHVVPDTSYITLNGGFRPGAIYTVTYTARGPHVAGLGLAGIRDALLFFRGDKADAFGNANPLSETSGALPTAVLAFGHSQSARVLQTMVMDGLARDGRGRLAFDGAYLNVAGGGKGSFNYRFGQSTRHFSQDVELDYPTDYFPFSTTATTDPETGVTASVLDRMNGGALPKLFYVNTGLEYWARSASLTHTTPDGTADLAPAASARIYFIAGGQHRPGGRGERGEFAHCRNPLDYRPLARALLLHLDAWVTLNDDPPSNAYPTLADGSLGTLAQYQEAIPKISSLRAPTQMLSPPRLDLGPRFTAEGIADTVPPKAGAPYTTLVPQPDADGLDKGGIRLPEIAVPLGTYTGWNVQNADTGAPERLGRWDGSFVPFPRGENERLAGGDPRVSIAERYPSRQAYTEAYAAATLALAEQELILGPDINPMIERAGGFYDRIMAHDPDLENCDYINAP